MNGYVFWFTDRSMKKHIRKDVRGSLVQMSFFRYLLTTGQSTSESVLSDRTAQQISLSSYITSFWNSGGASFFHFFPNVHKRICWSNRHKILTEK